MALEPVIISPNNLSTVSFALGLPLGAATEPKGGITKILATHLVRNTKNLDETELANKLDELGIQTFSNVSRTGMYLGMNCPPQNVQAGLDLFEEMIFEPEFSDDTTQKIVQSQLGFIQQLKHIPQIRMFVSTRFEAAFGDSRISRVPEGTQESLMSMTADDLESYHKEIFDYQPKFGAVGIDISEATFADTVSRFDEFGDKQPDVELVDKPVSALNKHIDTIAGKSKNAYVGLNMRIHGNNQSELEETIYSNILQGGFSSRMFTEIRDKRNLSYSVFNIVGKYPDFGLSTAGLDVKPERSAEALEVLVNLIDDVLHDDIEEGEMRRALKASQSTVLFVSDSSQSYTQWVIGRLLADREYDLDKENEKLKQASKGDWQETVLKFWNKDNLSLGITGEPGEIETKWESIIEEVL